MAEPTVSALLVFASLCTFPPHSGQPAYVSISKVEQTGSVWEIAGAPVGKVPTAKLQIWYTYRVRPMDDTRVRYVEVDVTGALPSLAVIQQNIRDRHTVRDCLSMAG